MKNYLCNVQDATALVVRYIHTAENGSEVALICRFTFLRSIGFSFNRRCSV